jgi:PhoPQ-activated pathogenicity-related protein
MIRSDRHVTIRLTVVLMATAATPCLGSDETALDRYIRKPDPTYAWNVVRTVPGDGITQFIVDLKSQTWRTNKEVNRTVWQHWLVVVKPEKLRSNTAFLLISGGRNGGEPPQSADARSFQIARATGTVVAELRMVPNQPLVFHGDGKPRNEDDLIGYTWDQFLRQGDDEWPARLPMVKSAVRAMDCVQELLGGDQGGKVPIDRFVVAGASKRGWTTWCTAAVDRRVAAIVPIVIDVLNVTPSIQHHAAVYGFYSLAIKDYFEHRILQRMNDPRNKLLLDIEDPYSYRDRLTMPKYIVNAAGDQFFCPDSSQFYFDQLKGEKHLRYVPNTDHSLRDSAALENLTAFYQLVLAGRARPEYSWGFERNGSIRVRAKTAPSQVTLWQATNPAARDFRLASIGKAFTSRPLTADADGSFVAKVEAPPKGWTACFVELVFDTDASLPFTVTTPVRVLPDGLPFAGKDPVKVPLEQRSR